MDEVRREDGELCGFVVLVEDGWQARTVFGAVLGTHPVEDHARRQVLEVGLAVLAERWVLTDLVTGDEEVVCIREARPGSVIVDIGYYPEPGVPPRTITADDLDTARLRLAPLR